MKSVTIHIFKLFRQVMMVYFSKKWILVVKIGHLTKWMSEVVFFAIEQVFGRAFCVF